MEINLHARKTDIETSQEAVPKLSGNAASIVHAMGNNAQYKVHGATCNTLATYLGEVRDSISPVMPQLERKGIVKRTGYKRDRQQVWILSEYDYTPLACDTEMKSTKRTCKKTQRIKELEELLDGCKFALGGADYAIAEAVANLNLVSEGNKDMVFEDEELFRGTGEHVRHWIEKIEKAL